LIINHICPYWLSRKYSIIYLTNENPFERRRFVAPSIIILGDNVQRSVKCKLDFDESKLISKQKPS
jgi:hypothetical protein